MITAAMPSPQIVNDQPAEQEEDDNSTPEYPLVLLRSPLDHADGVATNTQGIRHSVQPPLCPFEHFPLLAQIAEDRPSSV